MKPVSLEQDTTCDGCMVYDIEKSNDSDKNCVANICESSSRSDGKNYFSFLTYNDHKTNKYCSF